MEHILERITWLENIPLLRGYIVEKDLKSY